jgi:ribosomal protein L7Ae-like RNA K-turn-binding protein
MQKPLNKRKFRDEIINQSRLIQRPSQVKTGCKECSKALYMREKCWDKWHAQK